ncbi:MAG TPA: TonB-dependent receptor, partial [Arenimonas sp.]|nr:TonB-dependent receptor [Arenimonas sp.]
LRKDFNGVEMRYGIQQTEVKGGDQEEASVTFGIASDRGSLIGGAGMMDRENVFTRDQIGYVPGASTYGNNYYDWDYDGTGTADDGGPTAVPGYACDDEGFYPRPDIGRCVYDFNRVAANQASISNKSVFLMGDYQINDDWSIYSNATVTKVFSFGRYAPTPGIFKVSDGTPQDINFGVMAQEDPTYGTDAFVSDGLPTYFFHRFAAAGNRDDTVDTINQDFLVGFEGQLTDTVGVDFGLRRTRYEFNNRGNGYVISTLAQQAAESGAYDVRDPYGADPATLQGFTATISRRSFWKTDELFALTHFDLFEMPGGISNAVVGAEYRQDKYADQYDSLSEAGVVIGSAGNSSGGERTVGAAYFEWLFPFTTTFDVTVAGRYDRYSDYGSDFSPKVSARWQPMDNLTFRASYGQGFRAPGLDILTQKPAFSADPVSDPATCIDRGLPADCSGEQVDVFYIANPDLASEQSEQFGLGVVWAPMDWLDLSADYYNIEIEDTISSISSQDIINKDLDPGTFGEIPPGLSITRNPNSGAIVEIIAGYANEGMLETDGIDFRANTDFDLGGMGRLQNRLTVSWVNEYVITDGSGNSTDFIGLLGQPETRANLQNLWSMGDWTVVHGVNYIEGQEDSSGQVGGYATNDLQVSWEAPWNATIAVGATNIGDRYPELVDYDGRPWNFYLYDAYGRTTYFRYTQRF